MDQPGKVTNPVRGQLNRDFIFFSSPRSRLRVRSRETDSTVPFSVSLLILHTSAESGAFSREFSRFPRRRPFIYISRHTPSGQSRVYRVTELRTDGVHCRQSVDTGAVVVLRVVPVAGAASASPWTNECAPLFSHTHYWYEVGRSKLSEAMVDTWKNKILTLKHIIGTQMAEKSPYLFNNKQRKVYIGSDTTLCRSHVLLCVFLLRVRVDTYGTEATGCSRESRPL